MTKRHRELEKLRLRANLKAGVDHILDESFDGDRQRDRETLSGGKEGLAGIHDVRKEGGYKRLLAEINWWIAHADGVEPGILSPMRQELDPNQVFRLAGLTKLQIEAWELKMEGQALGTIAECLGISPGATQSRLNWGRLKLKVWISDALLDTG